MTLELDDCRFVGPALPEPFVRFELSGALAKLGLLGTGQPKSIEHDWAALRGELRLLGSAGGPQRVHNHVMVRLAASLGYDAPLRQATVATREGLEDGGWSLCAPDGSRLRSWSVAAGSDMDAPFRSGRAYRFSPTRSAQRVLLAGGERAGLLTNGEELRLLLSDPARLDSLVAIPLTGNSGWRERPLAPDSYRLVLALAAPAGLAALPELLDAARLSQTRVTRELRIQARAAIEGFVQAVLDHPANSAALNRIAEPSRLAATLWEEGLILVYRLLFILKLESAAEPARSFGFSATALWRTALSPNRALGPLVRRHLDQGHDTGRMLEEGLRTVFRLFRDGLACSELSIVPLGGALFGAQAMPLLRTLVWGERAVALLLDQLLWTTPRGRARERVQYGPLDVEDLGRIYEALLELEPGLTTEPMARLRRAKLEVVVSAEQAAPFRASARAAGAGVAWIEGIPAGRFFLRAGQGRKATGSYYTPHAFVRFLVRETLAPQLRSRSPDAEPDPCAILALKVLDPTMGSGHFLVEACRFLGKALYAACRLCDGQAEEAEAAAAKLPPSDRTTLIDRAAALRRRVADLPDADGTLLAYLPSRSSEAHANGVSQSRALALCRRLVAVHCLYGVDRNLLAVELAKLSLWLESYAEGLPLTFLDHRLVHGDAIAGPVFAEVATLPVGGAPLDPLLTHDVTERLGAALQSALADVSTLQASVGWNAAELVVKQRAKHRLDAALEPLRQLSRAWSGAVMLGWREADDEWQALAQSLARTGAWPSTLTPRQAGMLEAGAMAVPWDLTFPEVFRPHGMTALPGGFDAVLGNPPWDVMLPNAKEFLAGLDLSILDAPTRRAARATQARLLADTAAAAAFAHYEQAFARQHRVVSRLYSHQTVQVNGEPTGGKPDSYRVFAERNVELLGPQGAVGMVVPSAFHANEGATGIRRLYMRETRLEWCLSFENRRKLFDIDGRCKFTAVVARRPGPTVDIRCGFYLTEFAEIEVPGRLLDYSRGFIEASGGEYLTLLELRHAAHQSVAHKLFSGPRNFATWTASLGMQLSRELHMTDDAHRFDPIDKGNVAATGGSGFLLLHEGKTIHQFSDRWDTPPRYVIAVDDLVSKPRTIENARYFRAACREIAGATNERTSIAAMLPPGVVCGHTVNVERTPARRSNSSALYLVGVMNSFAFDWMLRQKSAAHASLYILAGLAAPCLDPLAQGFLAHASLRLCCNHAGYLPLWREQLGIGWIEASPSLTWPVIPSSGARSDLRAAMDAVVAQSYGLTRDDYVQILGGFSHKSWPAAPGRCLAAFDELAATGLQTFCRVHDPYFSVPTVNTLARPVVTFPKRAG